MMHTVPQHGGMRVPKSAVYATADIEPNSLTVGLKTMKPTLTLIFALTIAGCASTDKLPVTSPSGTAGGPPSTTIVGRMDREGPFTWQSYIPLQIDNKAVKHSFFANHSDTVVKVEPGVRRMVVRAAFSAGYGTGYDPVKWSDFITDHTCQAYTILR